MYRLIAFVIMRQAKFYLVKKGTSTMSLLSTLSSAIIPTAYAAAPVGTGTHPQGSPWSTVIMLGVFFVIFYFLLIRPQSKRAKAQRELLASLAVGDEVMTTGGIMGTIKSIDDNIVGLEISGTLSKGTVENSAIVK